MQMLHEGWEKQVVQYRDLIVGDPNLMQIIPQWMLVRERIVQEAILEERN